MSQRSIEDFKAQLKTGGVRPTMFEVQLSIPQTADWWQSDFNQTLRQFSFLCKGAQIPASFVTTMTIGLPVGGALKLPSSRVFEPWTVKVINDGEMNIRKMMEVWSRSLMGREMQTSTSPVLQDQFGTAAVYQLDRDGKFIRGYSLIGLYPSNVTAQDLSYEAGEVISEFDVTFDYQYWEPIDFMTDTQRRSSLFELNLSAQINAGISIRL